MLFFMFCLKLRLLSSNSVYEPCKYLGDTYIQNRLGAIYLFGLVQQKLNFLKQITFLKNPYKRCQRELLVVYSRHKSEKRK